MSVIIPNITKIIKDFTNPLTDYYYAVNASNSKRKDIVLNFHRNTLTRIRVIAKEIGEKGFYNTIENLAFNKDYNFLNINVNILNKRRIKLSDITVFVSHRITHERYMFNMDDVHRVSCMSETSTGKRTINRNESFDKLTETKPKRTRRRFNSEEERQAALKEYRKKYFAENKDKIRAIRKRYLDKLKAEGRLKKRGNTYKDVEKRRAYRKKWLEENKERTKAYQKKYYEKNKETILAKSKARYK